MKLLQTWFSFRGQMRLFDFITKGFAPGILLGIGGMFLENALDAHGAVMSAFLVFSFWPAAAMLTKVAASLRTKIA